ncbi:MAG: sigma factor-like helix-turn-helix DNA-binding protein [Clostridia bacterium]|nr:sigma factor-like helix-turn-helix DNA-binding protein [Clostridia bacterium]
MKIQYNFENETVEIDITDEWGEILIDLDREEYNANHRETRRHASLDALNADENLFASDADVEKEALDRIERERLYAAIEQLQSRQRELVRRVYFGGEKLADIAREEGVSKAALTYRMSKIFATLKKFLK